MRADHDDTTKRIRNAKDAFNRMAGTTLARITPELAMESVMLPVEGENPASVRVIEKIGGTLERRYTDDSGVLVSIYWIVL